MKRFNTTGVCIAEKHYMVDITERLKKMRVMIEDGAYFTINRGRQYGKTTTLTALKKYLADEYVVVSLDFQGISNAGFATEKAFVCSFCRLLKKRMEIGLSIPKQYAEVFLSYAGDETAAGNLQELFAALMAWCRDETRGIVLMIDEVDSATNNQVFLDFLAQLREGYIGRDTDSLPAFQSVILAGVTDIRHLRSKVRDESQHRVNSPWNIAVEFDENMRLSTSGIAGMLQEYEDDHRYGMDVREIAQLLTDYTGGYPFLVSRLCQLLDIKVAELLGGEVAAWTRDGIDEAVKMLLAERNTLFDSLMGKLTNYPELKQSLRKLLMSGEKIAFNPYQEDQEQLIMYGFVRNVGNSLLIDNRIFEMQLYNYFLSEEERQGNDAEIKCEGDRDRSLFIKDGQLDMPLILEHFIKSYTQIFGALEEHFKEKDGRELFLLYLRAIINGTGNYYIEAQTRDQRRTDVIVDYLGKQYIIELKIWHGERYNEEGEKQIREYLDYFGLDTGYMLSFNFNKKKTQGVRRQKMDGKVLYEGML